MAADQFDRGIVTPEAVVLEFETAGVGSRGLAKMIDVVVQLTALFVLLLAVAFASGAAGSDTVAVVLMYLLVFLVLFGYPVLTEIIWNGKTIGKAILGLRVVTRDGAPITFRHAAIRGIIGIVEVYVFSFIAILCAALSRENQRVGDMAAGSIVIRERTASTSAIAVAFPPPPGMEGYARSIDVSALSREQYQVIRSFLVRVFDFTPEARMALGVRLANPVAIALKHDPPPMVGPEIFLVCVAAAYQLRHGGPGASWPAAPPVGAMGGYATGANYGGGVGWTPPAAPAGAQAGYGASSGYGPPGVSPGYGASSGYGPPGVSPGYGAPPGYGPPGVSPGYGPPGASSGYGPPGVSPGYGPPGAPSGYGPPGVSPGYGAPGAPSGYGPPPERQDPVGTGPPPGYGAGAADGDRPQS